MAFGGRPLGSIVFGGSVTGAQYPTTLTATPVSVVATLAISKNKIISTTVTIGASLSKVEVRKLSATAVSVASTLSHLKTASLTATAVGSSAKLIKMPRPILVAGAVNTSAQIQSGHQYPINLTATVSVAASLALQKALARTFSVSISTAATLQVAISRILTAVINQAAILVPSNTLFRELDAVPLAVSATLDSPTTSRKLLAVPVTVSTRVQGIPSRTFFAVVAISSSLNKRGRYPQAPAVLQMYDLDTPYQLPKLKGATVSYMHSILGDGVAFDIYNAYVLANGAFYVCDNGLKQALDQDPVVVRSS